MRKKKLEKRNRLVAVCFTDREFTALKTQFEKTTHRYMSFFIRDILMCRPVKMKYRNTTADEFLLLATDIKRTLEQGITLLADAIGMTGADIDPASTQSHIATMSAQIASVGRLMNEIYQSIQSSTNPDTCQPPIIPATK